VSGVAKMVIQRLLTSRLSSHTSKVYWV